jgi:hypothetical protein
MVFYPSLSKDNTLYDAGMRKNDKGVPRKMRKKSVGALLQSRDCTSDHNLSSTLTAYG